MSKRHQFRFSVYLLLSTLALAQCTIEDCTSLYTDYASISFSDTLASTTNAFNSTRWDSIYGIGAEFAIVDTLTRSAHWQLPLNHGRDTVEYVFVNNSNQPHTDTLALTYRTVEYLLGAECGVEISFRDLDIWYHTFDSVRLVDSTVTFEVERNIIIYSLN